MSWWLLFDAACGLFCATLIVRELLWQRKRARIEATNTLPPSEERPDYRALAQTERACPDCGGVYVTLSGFRSEKSCDACVAKRFEASVEADRQFWRERGWDER